MSHHYQQVAVPLAHTESSDTTLKAVNGKLLIDFDVDVQSRTDCTNVRVKGDDAIYSVNGSACGGRGQQPTGSRCPLKNDVAVANCFDTAKSFRNGECVAPTDSVCAQAADASWGCVWKADDADDDSDFVESAGGVTDPSGSTFRTESPTTTGDRRGASSKGYRSAGLSLEKSESNCTPISVAGDATFCVAGPICSGDGGQPTGSRCPVQGDSAISDCLATVSSYRKGACVARMDSVCQRVDSGAWGCVWNTRDDVRPTAIDTNEGTTTASASEGTAIVVVVVAAMVLTGVIAGVAFAWFRHKRSSWREDADIVIDGIVTPSKSVHNEVFRRV